MLRAAAIRDIVESKGVDGYLRTQAQMLGLSPNASAPTDRDGRVKLHESFEVDGRKHYCKRPRDFSIRALFEGLVGPVDQYLTFSQDQAGLVEVPVAIQEAIGTGSFPSAVGQLIATEVITGYEDDAGRIGDFLVSPMQSSMKNERVVGFTALQAPQEVLEGQEYDESSFTEKYVEARQTKRGRLISITEETVTHDQTGQVLDRANALGYYAAQEREYRIVRGVADVDSGDAIYQPSGTGEQLYSSGNNNLDATSGALTDWTTVQAVLTYHALNVTDDRQADGSIGAQPINWSPKIILTAKESAGAAARIIAATEVTRASGSNQPEFASGNPLNSLAPGLMALSSALLDTATDGDQWDDATDWFLGDFKRQFREKVIWPLQTFRAPANADAVFRRDVIAQYKVRSYGDIIATDERHVVKIDVA